VTLSIQYYLDGILSVELLIFFCVCRGVRGGEGWDEGGKDACVCVCVCDYQSGIPTYGVATVSRLLKS